MNDIANTTLFIFFLGLALFFGAIFLTIDLNHRKKVHAKERQLRESQGGKEWFKQ